MQWYKGNFWWAAQKQNEYENTQNDQKEAKTNKNKNRLIHNYNTNFWQPDIH